MLLISNIFSRFTIKRGVVYGFLILLPIAAYKIAAHEMMTASDRRFEERYGMTLDEMRAVALEPGKVTEKDGRVWLRGGLEEHEHFDITEFRLNPDQLAYGFGRDVLPALLQPVMCSAEEADAYLGDTAPVLVAAMDGDAHVYPLHFMKHYEVVNDVVGGKPVFAAYCKLAELGAVYDREFGDQTYTFAVSGYTYADDEVWGGRSAFVLWDRETESLWWPPVGKAVSGPFVDTPLEVLDHEYWAQTTWGEVKAKYPNAEVLCEDQPHKRPDSWPSAQPTDVQKVDIAPDTAIAPQWGANDEL